MSWIEEIEVTEAEGKLVEKLTSASSAMTESDLDPLRTEGPSDQDILDITLIVAYFGFVNLIALGLGVSYSTEELAGYRDD